MQIGAYYNKIISYISLTKVIAVTKILNSDYLCFLIVQQPLDVEKSLIISLQTEEVVQLLAIGTNIEFREYTLRDKANAKATECAEYALVGYNL